VTKLRETEAIMADLTSDRILDLVPLDLLDVSSTTIRSTSVLHGIITIKWPYSSSSQKLTFLLADPDPRKRAAGGQVKITLMGEAAELVGQIESGESISIAAADGEFGSVPDIKVDQDNSGRIKWHITFTQGCILAVTSFESMEFIMFRLKVNYLDLFHLQSRQQPFHLIPFRLFLVLKSPPLPHLL
jgi:hypothetical protein